MRTGAEPLELTVIVPHYGDPAPAAALVAQLRTQRPAERHPLPSHEIVVVDDRSPRPFDAPGATGDAAPVRVVRRERNGGFGAAVNTGAEAARGELLLVLNSDLSIEPDFVARFVGEARPWLPAVVSPHVEETRGRSGWAGRHFPRTRHYAVEWLAPLARWRHLPGLHEAVGHDTRAVEGAVVTVDWVAGAAMLLPREALLRVGGIDEGYRMYVEEVDLQRRLRERGLPAVYLGTVRVEHVGGGSSDDERRRRWLVAARLRYARKWDEGPLRQRLALTAATLVNLAANLPRRALGRDVDPLATARFELDLIWGGGRGDRPPAATRADRPGSTEHETGAPGTGHATGAHDADAPPADAEAGR